jgi:hypothetical protein
MDFAHKTAAGTIILATSSMRGLEFPLLTAVVFTKPERQMEMLHLILQSVPLAMS